MITKEQFNELGFCLIKETECIWKFIKNELTLLYTYPTGATSIWETIEYKHNDTIRNFDKINRIMIKDIYGLKYILSAIENYNEWKRYPKIKDDTK